MATEQKTIIVAEDEPLVRMLAVEVLAEAGFRVIEAAHADEALARLNTYEGQVHLLFTDVHMPGSTLSGFQLAHLVRINWPKIALIITSAALELRGNELPIGGLFISKPYELAELIGHVNRLTGA